MTPPIAPLRDVLERLEGAGVVAALGGSALLVSLGLERAARDWDLTTDATIESLDRLFSGVAHQRLGPNGPHADHKLVFADGVVELIAGFALHHDAGVCRIPTTIAARWNGLPVGSPEAWAVGYTLLGRVEKAERLFEHLARTGAVRSIVERLLGQPLPSPLRERLRALHV